MNKLLALVVILMSACATDVEGVETEAQSLSRAPHIGFTRCDESIGVGLVDTAAAQALVPSSIIPVGAGTPVTPLVARTARCGIAIAGRTEVGSIIQIGLVIVPPATPGTIDNYTLGYVTDDQRLADILELEGVEVHRVARIDYDASATALSVHARELEIAGSIVPSTVPNGSFVANWWRASRTGLVEMTTTVPVIFNGTADLELTTTYQPLVDLLGAGAVGFPVLQQWNTFATADMVVTSN